VRDQPVRDIVQISIHIYRVNCPTERRRIVAVTVTHENSSFEVGIGICMIRANTLHALTSLLAFRENISRSPPVIAGDHAPGDDREAAKSPAPRGALRSDVLGWRA
jgi:hypothetical protein